MNNEQLHQDIGGLKAEVRGLRREVTTMSAQLTSIGEYIAHQKGARKATIGIATASASVAALIVSTVVAVFFK